MSPETREQKRERLWSEYAALDRGNGDDAEDLLHVVEASELKAAEEARASERERMAFTADRISVGASEGYRMACRDMAKLLRDASPSSPAKLLRDAATPSPEPERAPPDVRGHTLRFPNERFEAQSGNLPPLTYDWTPKPREPEALTERGFRQIGEAHNALVARVEALERALARPPLTHPMPPLSYGGPPYGP